MKDQFKVEEILKRGKIVSELELERALVADRQLRLLQKEDQKYAIKRKQLRAIIAAYEEVNWSESRYIPEEKILESDIAESLAEEEQRFIIRRKNLIRESIKAIGLNQQQLGLLLGHRNKSYISELMNGVSPFSLKDLVVIHKLLGIPFDDLIPVFLSAKELEKLKNSLEEMGKQGLLKRVGKGLTSK